MVGHAKKCVERYCELTNITIQQLYKVSTPCVDVHHFKKKKKQNLLENCHMYAMLSNCSEMPILVTNWTRMLDFGQFDFGQFDFGQLAEIELAEVEIGRSRTDGVCSVSSFSLSFFSFALSFYFSLFFLVLTHLSLHFFFVLFLFSSPKT